MSKQVLLAAFCLALALTAAACSSDWSDADQASVQSYCAASAEEHSASCASWIDGIHRLSDCDPDQAKRVIDRIIAEYNGAPALSVAENYQRVGCSYGTR